MMRNKLYQYGDDTVKIPAHMHFGKDLLHRMREHGNRVALITASNDYSMTFGELVQKSVDVSLSLAHMGVRKGDVVSVCSENRMELNLATAIGTICAGAVFAPAQPAYGSVSLQRRIQIIKPKVMFMSQTTYKMYKEMMASFGCIDKFIIYDDKCDRYESSCLNPNGDQIRTTEIEQKDEHTENGDVNQKQNGCQNPDGLGKREDTISFKEFLTETGKVEDFIPTPVDGWKDFAMIVFSTGTTGLPKAVPLTHLGLLMNCFSRTKESFKYLPVLMTPEWHLNFFVKFSLKCLWRGMTCIFTDLEREHEYLRAIEKYKVKILFLVPCNFSIMLNLPSLQQYDLSSVETILTTAAALGKGQAVKAKQRLPYLRNVYISYGMTESRNICNNLYAPFGPKDGSVGVALQGYVIKVVDIDSGKPLGPNQRGEICFTSPSLTPGYIGVDKVLTFDEEGFFKTGDFGYYDDDGYFFVLGRIEELMKYGDTIVAPAEIEALICETGNVREAGVASVNGALAAAVVLEDGATFTAAQIADYVHSKVPLFRLDGGVHFVKKVPRRGACDVKLDRPGILAMLTDIISNNN